MTVAVTYFLAAALVFPRNLAEWNSLDSHYWQHKRFVVGGILFANLASTSYTLLLRTTAPETTFWLSSGPYYAALVGLLLSRRKWLDLALLGLAILDYVVFAGGAALGAW